MAGNPGRGGFELPVTAVARGRGTMDTVSGGASGNPRVDCASRAGLTITELMVMMVMLAILLGLAIPRIDNWMRRARLKSAVAELTTAHFLTRSAAMRDGRPGAAYRCGQRPLLGGDRYVGGGWQPGLGGDGASHVGSQCDHDQRSDQALLRPARHGLRSGRLRTAGRPGDLHDRRTDRLVQDVRDRQGAAMSARLSGAIRNARGSSLIEIMVAVFVFAIGFLSLMAGSHEREKAD